MRADINKNILKRVSFERKKNTNTFVNGNVLRR